MCSDIILYCTDGLALLNYRPCNIEHKACCKGGKNTLCSSQPIVQIFIAVAICKSTWSQLDIGI